ncbi:MAG TPA: glycosyltransferase family 2 protein, partial [Clostridiales bacterium]|nr:glycosyltransferase family 2 protein [Clostridiales bacterium]
MRYSVIVPLYNAESTIKACIESVINQTYKDFELIIVDDGSTDKGGAFSDEYAKKFDNVKVFHVENGGAGKARNIGVSLSKGEYLLYLDSDDEWESSLLKNLEEYSSDVITFGYKIDYGQKIITKKIINESEELNVLNAIRIL